MRCLTKEDEKKKRRKSFVAPSSVVLLIYSEYLFHLGSQWGCDVRLYL